MITVYLSPRAGVEPHLLIDTDAGNAVELAAVIGQHLSAFGQGCIIGGVPRHREPFGRSGRIGESGQRAATDLPACSISSFRSLRGQVGSRRVLKQTDVSPARDQAPPSDRFSGPPQDVSGRA